MAEYLASIFGTEKDKVNCSFYFKIGACRHGERCSRIHNKPTFSQTILLLNLYQNPQNVAQTADGAPVPGPVMTDEEAQELFDNFFEDVFVEIEDKYGEIEEMNVCDNLGDHLVGNVYVKFRKEEDADKAVKDLNNRWFAGRPVYAELSPVTDFREACCRQYEMGECTRSGFCNFMHLKPISRELRRELYGRIRGSGKGPHKEGRHRNRREEVGSRRSRTRSRSVSRSRSRSKSKSRSRRRDRSHRHRKSPEGRRVSSGSDRREQDVEEYEEDIRSPSTPRFGNGIS
jgi:splicing factor U2AF subunit